MEPGSMEMGSVEGQDNSQEKHESARRAKEYARQMSELVDKLETTRELQMRDELQKQLSETVERFQDEAGKL